MASGPMIGCMDSNVMAATQMIQYKQFNAHRLTGRVLKVAHKQIKKRNGSKIENVKCQEANIYQSMI